MLIMVLQKREFISNSSSLNWYNHFSFVKIMTWKKDMHLSLNLRYPMKVYLGWVLANVILVCVSIIPIVPRIQQAMFCWKTTYIKAATTSISSSREKNPILVHIKANYIQGQAQATLQSLVYGIISARARLSFYTM